MTEHDIVVYGATGFTGRLVAEYLANHAPEQVRLGLAGRSATKLEAVRKEIASFAPRAASLPLLVANSDDPASLVQLAKSTKVLVSTVGPFAQYGTPVVAACAEAGTDYCDITGEAHWIRRIIDDFEEKARASGARIVPTCGYDSIPSDLGVLMLADEAEKRGLQLGEVKYVVGRVKGSFSGGTVASMLNLVDEISRDRSVLKVVMDPYSLNPMDAKRGKDGPDAMGVGFDRDLGEWTAPFVMAGINTRVVRRSNALLGGRYGDDFRYSERMGCGKGPTGLVRATGVTAGIGAFLGALQVPALRRVLAKKLPASGEGPSRDEREKGYFTTHLFATTKRQDGSEGPKLRGAVNGEKDPGYAETAKMLGESALCLALGEAVERRGGIWTPASALGAPLIERLRRAKMTFRVDEI